MAALPQTLQIRRLRRVIGDNIRRRRLYRKMTLDIEIAAPLVAVRAAV
ncbi:MAG: hypothetical protein ACPGRX_06505 [Bdellovibrionales bacterium]